jgi:hypothetical protein
VRKGPSLRRGRCVEARTVPCPACGPRAACGAVGSVCRKKLPSSRSFEGYFAVPSYKAGQPATRPLPVPGAPATYRARTSKLAAGRLEERKRERPASPGVPPKVPLDGRLPGAGCGRATGQTAATRAATRAAGAVSKISAGYQMWRFSYDPHPTSWAKAVVRRWVIPFVFFAFR